MARHFIARNKAGDFFFGFERNFLKGGQFEPKFVPDIEDGYSPALVFGFDQKEEVHDRLSMAGVDHYFTEL